MEPGEWIPEDREFAVWRLNCKICKASSRVTEVPIDRDERRLIALEFLKEHEACLHGSADTREKP